ncbi:hypothetical protein ACJJTC_000891 [Scirpophaga incertulas]
MGSRNYQDYNVAKLNKCPYILNHLDSSTEERFENNIIVNNPYSVSIQKRGSYYSTGALIDKQTVLTAARDFLNVRESIKLYKARLGSVHCKSGGVLLPIRSISIHPSYVMGKPDYDVAVLKLAAPVNITEDINPITLSNAKQKVISAKFKTTYWPRLINNGRILPTTAKERYSQHIMRVSMQRLIPWQNCFKLMKHTGAILDENSQCLIPVSEHHSTCMPDMGAPVVADDGLWGITSGWTSDNCLKRPSPTIFTRVNLMPIRDWLEDMMKPSFNSTKSDRSYWTLHYLEVEYLPNDDINDGRDTSGAPTALDSFAVITNVSANVLESSFY